MCLGHCPHDEVPEEANALLMHFARSSGREGTKNGTTKKSIQNSVAEGGGILDVIVGEAMLNLGGNEAAGKEL